MLGDDCPAADEGIVGFSESTRSGCDWIWVACESGAGLLLLLSSGVGVLGTAISTAGERDGLV